MIRSSTSLTVLFISFLVIESQQLLTLHDGGTSRADYPGCSQPNTFSCVRADINMEVIKMGNTTELPDGSTLHLSWRKGNSAVFKNGISEAVFTWNGFNVAGQVHLNGEAWALQGCGDGCYLWVGQTSNWADEEGETLPSGGKKTNQELQKIKELVSLGEEDSTTIATYSVMIWYTPEFRALFSSEADLDVFVDLIFVETNEGYVNSNIPVRAVKHCVKQHPSLNDIYSSSAMLTAFKDSMPLVDLRDSADAAALLVANFSGCGIAYTHTTSNCYTLSVTMKSCATGYYSFGHELGHNFGGKHNPEKYTVSEIASHPYAYGHAHLILPTGLTEYSGYRTILAYRAFGHAYRKNFYSNPNITFPTSGTATGVVGLSNHVRVITDNRFLMAACGDEKNTCSPTSATPTPPTPSPPTPTPPPPAPTKCEENGCEEEFNKNGVCVNTSSVNWAMMSDTYDLSAGSVPGQCTSDCNCVCLKKMGCPPSKNCLKKKGQCVMPNTIPTSGFYFTGLLCDRKQKCKCYAKCSSPKCEKKGGKCLLPGEKISPGLKPSGACNKKAKCLCYIPMCSPNKKCSKNGGQCYGPGMAVPTGAKNLGYCNKRQKCRCYKVEATTEPPQLEESLILVGGLGAGGSVEVLGNSDCSSLADYDNYGHSSFVTPDGYLMNCGGFTQTRQSCVSYNDNSWVYHSDLLERRKYAASVSLPIGVFLIGGWGEVNTTTEFLPKGSTTWTVGPVPPNPGRYSASCAAALSDSQFLIMGGSGSSDKQVEEYDTVTQTWKGWPTLTHGRAAPACAHLGDKIIVAGGYKTNGGSGKLTSTEVIDVNTKTSRVVGSMNYARAFFVMANVYFSTEVVFVLGGVGSTLAPTTMEKWNDADETWILDSIPLSPGRSSFPAVVLPSTKACSP